jgi:methylmalonyl-CoA/ethylmalonyl-CoA epimerase
MPEQQNGLSLSQIGQIALTVQDLSKSITFYRDSLGMKFLFEVPNMAFFDCAGVRLMLAASEKPEDRYGSVLYFKVGDIQQAFQTMRSREISFEGEPHLIASLESHDLWMVFFRDPSRNLLALMSEIPRT